MAREMILRSDMPEELRTLLGVDAAEGDKPIEKGHHATVKVSFDDGRVDAFTFDMHDVEARALKSMVPKAKTVTRRGRRRKPATASA